MVGMSHCAEAASIAAREIAIRRPGLVGLFVALWLVGGCKEDTPAPPLAQVRATTAQLTEFAPAITVTGVIAAQVQTDLSFRLSGKVTERFVNVGDHVTVDQILARLDPVEQQAEVDAAKAGIQSAEALMNQNAANLERLPAGARQHHAPRLRPGHGRPSLGAGPA